MWKKVLSWCCQKVSLSFSCLYSSEHCWVSCLSSLLLVVLNLARNEAWVVPRTLCSLRWCVGVFPTFKERCIIKFSHFQSSFVLTCVQEFSNYYFIAFIRTPVRLLRWNFFAKIVNDWKPLAIFAEICFLDAWWGS